MPLSIQIPYRGDEYLFQGISGAGHNIGEGITQMSANLKKLKAYRAMATDALEMDPDQVDKMSLPELEGHFQSVALKNQMEQTRALADERRARAADYQMRADEAQAWPQLMQEMMGGNQPAQPGPAQPTPNLMGPDDSTPDFNAMMTPPQSADPFSRENMVRAMGHMGATNPRLATALAREIIPKMMGSAESQDHPASWLSPGGNPYVFYHGQFRPDTATGANAEPIYDLQGNVLGYQTGKGGVVKPEAAKPLPPTFHSTLDKITETISDAQSKLEADDSSFADPKTAATVKASAKRRLSAAQSQAKSVIDRYHTGKYLSDDERDQMYQDLGLTGAPAAAAAGPETGLPVPKTKAEMETGKLYQTGKGLATWDGKQFVPFVKK